MNNTNYKNVISFLITQIEELENKTQLSEKQEDENQNQSRRI